MTLRCFSDKLHHGSPRGLLQIIHDTIQGHQQPIWLLFAAVSLLSARHLLIEKNVHYPVQLYLHQIVATAIIALVLHLRQRRTHVAKNHESWAMPSAGETLPVASAHSFAAMSIFCTLQATLHFTNLPTLVMLTVSVLRLILQYPLLTHLDGSFLHGRFDPIRCRFLNTVARRIASPRLTHVMLCRDPDLRVSTRCTTAALLYPGDAVRWHRECVEEARYQTLPRTLG